MGTRRGGFWVAAVWLCCSCERPPASNYSYYEDRIAPIFQSGCSRQTTGCHVDDGSGFALGNLDLGSYDALMRRSDVLAPYGPYPVGVLLLKSGEPVSVDVRTIDPPDPARPELKSVRIYTDIRHAAGNAAITQRSPDYARLKQWIDGGHTRTGVPRVKLVDSQGPCVHEVPEHSAIDLAREQIDEASFARFVNEAQPVLVERCAGSACHGREVTDLYLTCGATDAERRWNYAVSVRHLDIAASASELLRRPLAMAAGGGYHEGGDVFEDVDDPDYLAVRAWAEDVVSRAPEVLDFGEADPGLRFYANRVQPLLVRKGCMFLNCHSPAMFHDLRLRSGTAGFFSSVATFRNYEMMRSMLALDAADPNQSRLIAKNLCPAEHGGSGIQHRGGALLEDFGGCADAATRADPADCAGVDAEAGDLNEIPAYCVFTRWHALEREQAIARGELPDDAPPRGVVFITRPRGVGGSLDFETFRPGADVMRAEARFDAAGALSLGPPRSLLASCRFEGEVDIRGLAVSWDATRIAFAAREEESAPLRIYELAADGGGCTLHEAIAAHPAREGDSLIHDFDPAYAPDGQLVFTSTRGNLDGGTDYRGPTRTPASLALNANLYVYEPGAAQPIRQLTYLLNQELAPSFMSDGRVIFTAEKRALDFHQLAARRINLDGGDYHPLFAQRPSVGFESATEVVELANRNFAMVAAPLDAIDGGGAIVIVNRSIGPDQSDRDPRDRAYIHSLNMPAAGAFGGDVGVMRSPAPLPTGRLLAACDRTAPDLSGGQRHYELCELDPTGAVAPRVVLSDPARVIVEPVALWPRLPRQVFRSRNDEANGSTRIEPGSQDVVILYSDLPMLATLLFSNTRTGRPIPFDFESIELFESRPPPSDALSFADLADGVQRDRFGDFFQELRSLGRAPLQTDGSLQVRIPGGMPFSLELQDRKGNALRFGDDGPMRGTMRQREELQYYPGERSKQSIRRSLFNGMCGGCHGSITGRELDVVVGVDVLTAATKVLAEHEVVDLR